MSKNDFVEFITKRDEDFAKWFTDVIKQADLVDYSNVKGFMVLKPYGYAIWELMQKEMDEKFKAVGIRNAYFPLLIPESLLNKEIEHVEGFAPEVAWVTQSGNETLTERLCIRPTSETIICSMYSKWIQSYRDLPLLLNQWCNVVRMEKTTRPFLRTSEFLWQEGHTAHASAKEAEEMALQMLSVYESFAFDILAIPVATGKKSEKEKFAGAKQTFTMEALMQDGRALQLGTSHDLGQHFAKVFDIKFLNKDSKEEYAHQVSFGSTTRMIGGVIMVHADDRGLKLPPKVAPYQAVILPIAAHKGGVTEVCDSVFEKLKQSSVRAYLDDRDTVSPGFKFNEWELKGVPLRIEIGPKDIEKEVATVFRRDTLTKEQYPLSDIEQTVEKLLLEIHQNLLDEATKHRDEHTVFAENFDEFKKHIEQSSGFVKAYWCNDSGCEQAIKDKTGATTRCAPFDQSELSGSGVCVHCGKKAEKLMYFAKAY